MLPQIISTVKRIAGTDYLYFDNALSLPVQKFCTPFNVWAVCVSPKDELFIMDSDEQWHKVESWNLTAIPALYTRIKLISNNYSITQ
jgi:hypothetical protein